MKYIAFILLFLSMWFHPIEAKAYQTQESICVMCLNDQQILYEQNTTKAQSVASISKVMTAIIAIENGNLNDFITIDSSVFNAVGSSIYLKIGDIYTLEDLLYGLMLRSGNDAACMIANYIAGSEKKFVQLMNKKARQLNMKNSIFHNASGLDENDGGNISTACDMALLMRYAMGNEIFKKIVSTTSYSPKKGIVWNNKNRFLKEYAYATGGKTGYTKKAGRTLITTSQKDNFEVIVVTLRCNDDFNRHQQLHDYIYNNYSLIKLIEKGKYYYKNKVIHIDNNLYQCLPKQDTRLSIKGKYNHNILNINIKNLYYKQNIEYEVKYE